MPKINLLNKIQKRQLQKRKATKNCVWIIAKKHNDSEYYVIKADKDGYKVFWTSNKTKAMKFHTEKGCQHFIKAYLNNRSDIHLTTMEFVAE